MNFKTRIPVRRSLIRVVPSLFLLLIARGHCYAQNPDLVPVLKGLLQQYKGCIIEDRDPRNDATCVAGNSCSKAYRLKTFNDLQVQADQGNITNFEEKLKSIIINDCFTCDKHHTEHTKHVHCNMECNGDNGIIAGPCFEGCKAGVDITKLVNDVINAIHNVLKDLKIVAPDETSASGGPSIATNRIVIDPGAAPESCDASGKGYYVAPSQLLDWTPTSAPPFKKLLTNYDPPASPSPNQYNLYNVGANEGRLRSDLREAAATANPVLDLCKSAAAFALGNAMDGNAFADLSVTGTRAFFAFKAHPPQEADVLPCLRSNSATQAVPDALKQRAVSQALDRAYSVLANLRAGGWPGASRSSRGAQRDALKYIAVSGEDDQPHRPVNVPSAEFPQYDLDVSVRAPNGRSMLVHTRYMIAHTTPPPRMQTIEGNARIPSVSGNTRIERNDRIAGGRISETDRIQSTLGGVVEHTLPVEEGPALAPNAEVILYIHGMDSRLEESLDLTHALIALGRQRNKNYTVIAMDLPTSGYADKVDYNAIAPLSADGQAGGGVDGLGFAPNKYVVPVVDFIEDFIVAFVNKLDRSVPVTRQLRAIVGGSLGGNMSMRLGRPRPDAPWIKTVIPWSPAAIWPSFADDDTKHAALAVSWYLAGGDPSFLRETPGSRRSFFFGGFDWQSKAIGIIPLGGGKPQAEYWYSDGWPCKKTAMRLDRLDRYETYNQSFRRWHWRLGMEQLLFSQQIQRGGQPLYFSNTIRMLLMCGLDDKGGDLCEDTRQVAEKMQYTPGYARFLEYTGHSIHNERPNFLARAITEFVDSAETPKVVKPEPEPVSHRAREPEPTTTLTVTISRVGPKQGTAPRPHGPAISGSRVYARVKILDGTYAETTKNRIFSKSMPEHIGNVPIELEVWSELPDYVGPDPRRGGNPDGQGQGPSSVRNAKAVVRTIHIVYDLRSHTFTARDGAGISRLEQKLLVRGTAGVELVLPSSGPDAPEVAFTIEDRLN